VSLKYLLDTNVVSRPFRPDPPAALMEKLVGLAGQIGIATVVWHELTYGVSKMEAGRRKSALSRYLNEVVLPGYPQVPYDQAAAHWHGVERARLRRAGRPVPLLDGQVAAIAVANSLTLVTNNTRDFESFKGLELEDWLTP